MTNKILWSQVYSYFTSSENISLRNCAERFSLNYNSLRQKASKEGWTWKKGQIFRNAYVLMDSRTAEEIAKRNEQQIQLARVILAKAAQALSSGIVPQNAEEIRKWIEVGTKIERICLGLENPDSPKLKIANQERYQYKF